METGLRRCGNNGRIRGCDSVTGGFTLRVAETRLPKASLRGKAHVRGQLTSQMETEWEKLGRRRNCEKNHIIVRDEGNTRYRNMIERRVIVIYG